MQMLIIGAAAPHTFTKADGVNEDDVATAVLANTAAAPTGILTQWYPPFRHGQYEMKPKIGKGLLDRAATRFSQILQRL